MSQALHDMPLFRFHALNHPTRRETIDQRFVKFHRRNPHVFTSLRQMALDLKQHGHTQYGIKSLFEVLRWQHALQTTDKDFKLNNNYTSRYARLIMEQEPLLVGFFSLRELRTG